MARILRHPAAGFILTAVIIAAVLLIPATREVALTAFVVARDGFAQLPGAVLNFITSIF